MNKMRKIKYQRKNINEKIIMKNYKKSYHRKVINKKISTSKYINKYKFKFQQLSTIFHRKIRQKNFFKYFP